MTNSQPPSCQGEVSPVRSYRPCFLTCRIKISSQARLWEKGDSMSFDTSDNMVLCRCYSCLMSVGLFSLIHLPACECRPRSRLTKICCPCVTTCTDPELQLSKKGGQLKKDKSLEADLVIATNLLNILIRHKPFPQNQTYQVV